MPVIYGNRKQYTTSDGIPYLWESGDVGVAVAIPTL